MPIGITWLEFGYDIRRITYAEVL